MFIARSAGKLSGTHVSQPARLSQPPLKYRPPKQRYLRGSNWRSTAREPISLPLHHRGSFQVAIPGWQLGQSHVCSSSTEPRTGLVMSLFMGTLPLFSSFKQPRLTISIGKLRTLNIFTALQGTVTNIPLVNPPLNLARHSKLFLSSYNSIVVEIFIIPITVCRY